MYAAGLGLGRQPARVRGPDAADQLVLRVAAPEVAALLLLQELGRRGLDARRRVGRALRVRRHVRRELVALVLLRVVARLFGGQFLRDDAEEGWRITRLLVMIGRFNLDEKEGRTQLRAKKKRKRKKNVRGRQAAMMAIMVSIIDTVHVSMISSRLEK